MVRGTSSRALAGSARVRFPARRDGTVLSLPPIYPITDAGNPLPLAEQVRRLGAAGFPLVQFRGKPLDPQEQWLQLRQALREARDNGGWPMVCVNDRADLAVLAASQGLEPWGLHLGQDDLPPSEARRLPGLGEAHLGTSTHEAAEWGRVDEACDHAGLGPFRATVTKGDHAEPIGLEGLRRGCAVLRGQGLAPVAIGGLRFADAEDCFRAGAESLAMVGEIARAERPEALLWETQLARWRVRPLLRVGQGVALIGGSGSGKSQLAQALGARLAMPARDLDEIVAQRAGKSISRIFAEDGEPTFRRLEEDLLSESLGSPCVMALGGGAWQSSTIRERLGSPNHRVIWLAENPAVAWVRVAQDPGRPLAGDRTLFMDRWRARVAHWGKAPMVLPLGRTPDELADRMLAP